MDGEIVNLFRVVRSQGQDLIGLLELTPFSRDDYRESFKPCEDTLEQARRTCVRSFMGFGSNSLCRNIQSGFRANSNRSGTTPAHDWKNYPSSLKAVIERLQGVVIENRDAIDLMLHHDSLETLHYCDPPYVQATRSAKVHGHHGYSHEMTDEQHSAFLDVVRNLKGMVCISGYAHPLYDSALANWNRVERNSHADSARDRVEVLWMNYQAPQERLFK